MSPSTRTIAPRGEPHGRRAAVLLRAARSLAESAGTAAVYQAITDGAARLREGALAALWLRTGDDGVLELAARTAPADPARTSLLGDHLARRVLGAGRAMQVCRTGGRSGPDAPAGKWAGATWYGFPLDAGGRGAALVLAVPATGRPLTAPERRSLEMYAQQASLALRLTRAQEALHHQHAALDAARRELLECAKLLALGHLVSDVVHEASNLLGGLTLRLEALLENPPDQETAGLVLALHGQCRQIADLMADLRRLSNGGGRVEIGMDVDASIDRLLRLRRTRLQARRITVERVSRAPLPRIRADRSQLEHALLALLLEAEEALTAIPEGGTIWITTDVRRHADVTRVLVAIEDDGPSIEPDLLPHVFDPLAARGDRRGPSVTLAAARAVIAAHGGCLTVANRPGGGVVARAELPVA